MSAFEPPAEASPLAGFDGRPGEPVPLNAAAVVGFISSLVVYIPLVTQLLGIVLGIVGIFGTSGGRQRGRALAISAVCISGVVLFIWVGASIAGLGWLSTTSAVGMRVESLLADDAQKASEEIAQFREDNFSARLKLKVNEEDLAAFLAQAQAKYGTLRSARFAEKTLVITADGHGLISRRAAEFTEGEARIEVTLGFDGLSAQIDNVSVGDLTLAPPQ